jgi:hypothetical protein
MRFILLLLLPFFAFAQGTRPPGANIPTRTIYVENYGARGDSATNCNAAFAAAIAALPSTGGTVNIGPGRFILTAPVNAYNKSVVFEGAGQSATKLIFRNTDGIVLSADTTTLGGGFNARGSGAKTLTIEGQHTANGTYTGLIARGIFNLNLSDLQIDYIKNTAHKCRGIYIRPATNDFIQEVSSHSNLSNLFIVGCDTGIVIQSTNLCFMENVRVDQSERYGAIITGGLTWNNGMLQGSLQCGLEIKQRQSPYPVNKLVLRGLYFEGNARDIANANNRAAIYKGWGGANMAEVTISNCLFLGSLLGPTRLVDIDGATQLRWHSNVFQTTPTDTLRFNRVFNSYFRDDELATRPHKFILSASSGNELTLKTSAALNFPSTAPQSSSDLIVTVSGAEIGDAVTLMPLSAAPNNTAFTAQVTALNTVTVRFNNYSTSSNDPTSITFDIVVDKF